MFYLRDFKNFAQAELDVSLPVTLLIGPNGSGKSNIIEAVELLAFLAEGGALHEITDIGRGGRLEIRGGLEACARRGTEQFTLGFRGGPAPEYDYEITIRCGAEPAVIAEKLTRSDRRVPVFEILPEESDGLSGNSVRYDNHSKGRNKPVEVVSPSKSALAQYARFAKKNTKLADTLSFLDSVIAMVAAPAVFDPIPRAMRDHQRASEKQLARNGFNISPALNALYVITRGPSKNGKPTFVRVDKTGTAERILNRIKQLPDEAFSGFKFDNTESGDVMFGFTIKGTDGAIYAKILSDGTLRALAIFTALETSPEGRRLILEEFDNGVHPSRVSVLTDAIFDCAKRNSLHVIATTHNPAALNALTSEQLGSVLLAIYDSGTRNAKLLPLTELPGYIDFVEQGRLGDLVTQRVYEEHLVPNYEKRRIDEMQAVFADLP